jgi:hypothetical protein
VILFALKTGVFEYYFGTLLAPLRRQAISNSLSRDQYKKGKKGQNERFQLLPLVISVVFLRVRS